MLDKILSFIADELGKTKVKTFEATISNVPAGTSKTMDFYYSQLGISDYTKFHPVGLYQRAGTGGWWITARYVKDNFMVYPNMGYIDDNEYGFSVSVYNESFSAMDVKFRLEYILK